ncbi:MAG: hypothetical protein RLZZ227_2002 [Pseudomonadota bacterium]|jgi:hypothetical protein
MKKRYADEQMIRILREAETKAIPTLLPEINWFVIVPVPVAEIIRRRVMLI